jgi:hypothetical protein
VTHAGAPATTDIPAEGGQEMSGMGVWERTGEEGLGLGLVSTHVRFGAHSRRFVISV